MPMAVLAHLADERQGDGRVFVLYVFSLSLFPSSFDEFSRPDILALDENPKQA
jgi:hypothetical protein